MTDSAKVKIFLTFQIFPVFPVFPVSISQVRGGGGWKG